MTPQDREEEQSEQSYRHPPYTSDDAEITFTALTGTQILAPHGVVIWQHAARRLVPAVVLGRPCWKSRHYGNTQLSLYALRQFGLYLLSAGLSFYVLA